MHDRLRPDSDAAYRTQNAPRVLLIGSFVSFSDRILFLLRDEFPGFDFRRVDPASLSPSVLADNHLLICDEVGADNMIELVTPGSARVALAFVEIQSVADRLANTGMKAFQDGLSLLPMNIRLDAWLSIMKLLLQGETYVPVDLIRIMHGLTNGGPDTFCASAGAEAERNALADPAMSDPVLPSLTDRERMVLLLLARGMQNKAIAHELEMSENTAKLHVHHLMRKLGVRNRTEAARWYLSQPLRPEEP